MDLITVSIFYLIVIGGLFYLLVHEKRESRSISKHKDSLVEKLLEKNSDLTDKIYFMRKDEYLAKKALDMPLEDMPTAPKSEEVGVPLGEADPFEVIEGMAANGTRK